MASPTIVGALDSLAHRFLPRTYVQENRGAVRTMLYAPLLEFGPGRVGTRGSVDSARVSYMLSSAAYRLRTHGAAEDADALEELSSKLQSAQFPRLLGAAEADSVLFLLLTLAGSPEPRARERSPNGSVYAFQRQQCAPDAATSQEYCLTAILDKDVLRASSFSDTASDQSLHLDLYGAALRLLRGVHPLPNLPEHDDDLADPPVLFDANASKLSKLGLEYTTTDQRGLSTDVSKAQQRESAAATEKKPATEKKLAAEASQDDWVSTAFSKLEDAKSAQQPPMPRWEELCNDFNMATELPGAPQSPAYVSDVSSQAFDALYRLYTKVAEKPSLLVISEEAAIQATINVLLGVVSPLFAWNETQYCYEPQGQIRTSSTTQSSLQHMLQEFALTGSLIKRLDMHASTIARTPSMGRVSQAFAQAISLFLQHFRSSILSIREPVLQRRAEELDDGLSSWLPGSGPNEYSSSSEISLLELYSHSRSLRDQLALIASVCKCSHEGWTPEEVEKLPHGGALLEHLFLCSLGLIGPSEHLVSSILQKSLRPYLEILGAWVTRGLCEDPFDDFFVVHTWRHLSDEAHCRPDFWESSFQLDSTRLPCFLQGIAAEALTCGKALRVLMLRDSTSSSKTKVTRKGRRGRTDRDTQASGQETEPVKTPLTGDAKQGQDARKQARAQPEKLQPATKPVLPSSDATQEAAAQEEKHDPALVELAKAQVLAEYSARMESLELRALKARWRRSRLEHRPSLKASVQFEQSELKSELQDELREAEAAGQASAISNIMAVLGLFTDVQAVAGTDESSAQNISIESVPQGRQNEKDSQSEHPTAAVSSTAIPQQLPPPSTAKAFTSSELTSEGITHRAVQPELVKETNHMQTNAADESLPNQAAAQTATSGGDEGDTSSELAHDAESSNDVEEGRDQVHDNEPQAAQDDATEEVEAAAEGREPSTPEADDTLRAEEDDWSNLIDSFSGSMSLSTFMERKIQQKIHQRSISINADIVQYFREDLCLVEHLESLRQYAFMYAGDLFDLMLTSMFEELKGGRAPNHVRANLLFESSVKATGHDSDPHIQLVSFVSRRRPLQGIDHTGVDGLDFLELCYQAGWPLCLVITPDSMEKYNKIFRYLIQQRRIIFELRTMWFSFQGKLVRQAIHDGPSRRLQLFRQELQHFIGIFHSYVMQQLDICWVELTAALAQARTLDEIRAAHSTYLSTALSRCLLSEAEQPSKVMQIILATFNHILQACRHLFPASPISPHLLASHDASEWSESTLASCTRSFRQSAKFLLNTLKKLSVHSGNSAVEGLLESWNFSSHLSVQ